MYSDSPNLSILRECLTAPIIRKASLEKKASSNTDNDAAELSDFIDYLTTEIYSSLPRALQSACYNDLATNPSLSTPPPSLPIPTTFSDSLLNYNLVADDDDVQKLFAAAIKEYLEAACAPPPVWSETRKEECEICERNVPLTYHHLIPVCVVSCHSTVHKCEPNEVLAKEYFTVKRLLEREDIQRWRKYISKQRWGPKPFVKGK
ncbi:hypothetical protein RUND412_003641 [Rhizina undulata]